MFLSLLLFLPFAFLLFLEIVKETKSVMSVWNKSSKGCIIIIFDFCIRHAGDSPLETNTIWMSIQIKEYTICEAYNNANVQTSFSCSIRLLSSSLFLSSSLKASRCFRSSLSASICLKKRITVTKNFFFSEGLVKVSESYNFEIYYLYSYSIFCQKYFLFHQFSTNPPFTLLLKRAVSCTQDVSLQQISIFGQTYSHLSPIWLDIKGPLTDLFEPLLGKI